MPEQNQNQNQNDKNSEQQSLPLDIAEIKSEVSKTVLEAMKAELAKLVPPKPDDTHKADTESLKPDDKVAELQKQFETLREQTEKDKAAMRTKFRISETKRLLQESGIHNDFVADTEYFAEKLFVVDDNGDLKPKDTSFKSVDDVMKDFVSKHKQWIVKDTPLPTVNNNKYHPTVKSEFEQKLDKYGKKDENISPQELLQAAFMNQF